MVYAMQNCLVELSYISAKEYNDPFNEVEFKAAVIEPDGEEKLIPGFWGGGNTWRLRYSSAKTGIHKYRTACSDKNNRNLDMVEGEIMITPYRGENILFKHGALKKSDNCRHLVHDDGTPFFWLGDTWWMGFTSRLKWPEEFQLLTNDRVKKGFSVVQIVAGLYPDMDPFDERGANEAGFPWDKDFKSINPDYFDMTDMKVAWLVNAGLVPCIVGCWGFYSDLAGSEAIKKHWEYLLARYGAYPVVWCMAGEAVAPFYNNSEAYSSPEKMEEYFSLSRKEWTEITRYFKTIDPYHRLITVHPTDYGHKMLDDESLIDLDMLQTGHDNYNVLDSSIKMIIESVNRKPVHPVINAESCYEGICGSSFQDVQRFLIWSSVLNGACGHTYGANGIWQVNTITKPYGFSPHGTSWGDTPWEEAYRLPGSEQVGIARKLFEKYNWWDFKPHPEWINEHITNEKAIAPSAAGIPGEVRIIFIPVLAGCKYTGIIVQNVENDIKYRAYYFNPENGGEIDLGIVRPDEDGNWKPSKMSIFQDWVLVMQRCG
jgi:hypothetical protein